MVRADGPVTVDSPAPLPLLLTLEIFFLASRDLQLLCMEDSLSTLSLTDGIANEYIPDLTGKKGINGVQPIVHFLIAQGLQQISSVLGDNTVY